MKPMRYKNEMDLRTHIRLDMIIMHVIYKLAYISQNLVGESKNYFERYSFHE